MDILQITKNFYIDIDEICIMNIVENKNEKEKNNVFYSVIGITKNGLQVVLFVDNESRDVQRCINWVYENWIKRKQKRKFF